MVIRRDRCVGDHSLCGDGPGSNFAGHHRAEWGHSFHGQVSITGITDIPNFASAELDFAYASTRPAVGSSSKLFPSRLHSIAAGIDFDQRWRLRSALRVTLQDGSSQDATVKVKVQNQAPPPTVTTTITPVITSTPAFTPQPSTPVVVVASPTSTSSPVFPTLTPLPPNPVEVKPGEIFVAFNTVHW